MPKGGTGKERCHGQVLIKFSHLPFEYNGGAALKAPPGKVRGEFIGVKIAKTLDLKVSLLQKNVFKQ